MVRLADAVRDIDHINRSLALATGCEGGKVPFKKMAETPTHYVSALQLPNGINFKDPAHYKGEETFQILKLWRQRQALGKFHFASPE